MHVQNDRHQLSFPLAKQVGRALSDEIPTRSQPIELLVGAINRILIWILTVYTEQAPFSFLTFDDKASSPLLIDTLQKQRRMYTQYSATDEYE